MSHIRRRLATLGLVCLGVVGLAACEPVEEVDAVVGVEQDVGDGEVLPVEVRLPDGRTVTCVLFDNYNGGGVSCDWLTATTEGTTP